MDFRELACRGLNVVKRGGEAVKVKLLGRRRIDFAH